jgi:hypothetical protein
MKRNADKFSSHFSHPVRNPKADVWRESSKIQTLLFDKRVFNVAAAKAWARRHDFKYGKTDVGSETSRFIRLRQYGPDSFVPGHLRTITLKPGIQAVVGEPQKARKNPAGVKIPGIKTKELPLVLAIFIAFLAEAKHWGKPPYGSTKLNAEEVIYVIGSRFNFPSTIYKKQKRAILRILFLLTDAQMLESKTERYTRTESVGPAGGGAGNFYPDRRTVYGERVVFILTKLGLDTAKALHKEIGIPKKEQL